MPSIILLFLLADDGNLASQWQMLRSAADNSPPVQVTSTATSANTSSTQNDQQVVTASTQPLPWTSSSGEAIELCCYSAMCSYTAINNCTVLSPEGKIIAFVGMAIGGVTGFILGSSLAVGAFGILVSHSGPLPVVEVPADELLTLSFLNAAAGLITGSLLGALAGLAYDGTLSVLTPQFKKKPKKRQHQKESPPPAPTDDPPPAY